jgi:O-antigen/teichoic acid export membrane protein
MSGEGNVSRTSFAGLRPRSDFARNVFTVFRGATIAQAIPVALSFVLTRLYTPADLGALALYVSIITIAGMAATGRYELAILIPRRDREAFDLFVLSILASAAFSIVLFGLLIGVSAVAPHALTRFHALGPFLYALPASVFLIAAFQSLNYWYNRRRYYGSFANARIGQAATMGTVQVTAGAMKTGAAGLIGGYLSGQVVCVLTLVWLSSAEFRDRLAASSRNRVRAAGRRHIEFPRYLIPGHLANVASMQVPVLFLSYWYPASAVGSYSLAERVLVLPMTLIGAAIGDVYRQQAAATYQETGNCRSLYLRTARRLAAIAVLPIALGIVVAPSVFPVVFGSAWRTSGEIAQLLGVMVFFQLVSSPLSQTVYLAGMYRADLIWQLTRLALAVAAFYFGHRFSTDFRVSVALYAGCLSALHLAHSVLQYRAACGGSFGTSAYSSIRTVGG